MKLSLSQLVFAGVLCAASLAASAQELKIGVVNSERLLRDSQPAKAAQSKLEAEFAKREKELADQGNKLRGVAEKLEKEGPTLSEAERTRRQRELTEQDRDFQRRRREYQEDLNTRKNEELASVVERANRVLREIFEKEKYDMIMQDVTFAGPRVDITDKVIKALNAASAAPAATPASK
jgi:outer membrane protein